MKNNAVFNILFISTLMVNCSCHHSSKNHTTYGGTLSCNVNGILFNAAKCESSDGITREGTVLIIVGAINNLSISSINNTFMHIEMVYYNGIGQYMNGPYPNSGIGEAFIDSSTSAIGSAYGTLTVDSVSPNIVGKFSFTASDSTKVTNGRFSVPAPN